MKTRNIVIVCVLISGFFTSCMMFGGFATKLYLNKVGNETTNLREVIYDNYKIVADIPESFVGKEIEYSIKINDLAKNKIITNNDICLEIKKRYKSKIRLASYHYKYVEIDKLTPEISDKERNTVNTFVYKFNEQGSYQLSFTIMSIDGEQLDVPLIVITNLKVL